MKKVFITGLTGFAGSHLATHLLSQNNYSITGTYNDDKSLSLLESRDKITAVRIDLMDREAVEKLIAEIQPDWIFHLAALAATHGSFDDPTVTITSNVTMQVYLFEAARKAVPNANILSVSSAEVYGKVAPEKLPIHEDLPFNPGTPYAVSKVTQDMMALQYVNAYDMSIVRVRPFNHIGPNQSPNFAISSFAKQIAEIEKGQKEAVLHVGNLTAKRDFTDVRDIVKGYELLLEKGEKGDVYNLGSGTSHTIQEVLDTLLSLSNTKIGVKTDESLFRPADTPELLCDHSKFTKLTGWEATIPLEQTLKDTLEYWRKQV